MSTVEQSLDTPSDDLMDRLAVYDAHYRTGRSAWEAPNPVGGQGQDGE